MASPNTELNETSATTPHQKFQGHTDAVWGVIHLPDGQQIITCSFDGSLRVWNLKSRKQIGEDWRDGESEVKSIMLSPDGKKVASGSYDGAVRLWDIDTGKVITKWTGHTRGVLSVSWSRDGQRVLSGSNDGTARQWDVESGETILKPIETGHNNVWAVIYSPDTTLIATGGWDHNGPWTGERAECSVKIWDAKTGKLVTTLEGHTDAVRCLAWTKDSKTLVSGSYDHSIRIWNTTRWEKTAALVEHADFVMAITISPNGCILASVSYDNTARLWNLENGQPISSPLQHAEKVNCVSFSMDGKQLAIGCDDKNTYVWDVAVIVKEAGLNNLSLEPEPKKSAFRIRPPVNRVPQNFLDGIPPPRFSARSPNPPDSTFLSRLFHRNPSSARNTSPSSPLDWAQNLLKRRTQSGEGTDLQGRSHAIVGVPYAKGKRRNASAREVALAKQKQKMKPPHFKNPTAGNSQSTKPNATRPSLQPPAAMSSSSTTPVAGDPITATTLTPSRPDAMIRQAGLWTRFWLFLGCLSPVYSDGHH